MAKIVKFNPPQEDIVWCITVGPRKSEYASADWEDDVGWMCFITASSFDQIPALKEEALQELKVAKALKRGKAQ